MSDRDLQIRILAETAQAEAALNKIKATLGGMGSAATTAGRHTEDFGKATKATATHVADLGNKLNALSGVGVPGLGRLTGAFQAASVAGSAFGLSAGAATAAIAGASLAAAGFAVFMTKAVSAASEGEEASVRLSAALKAQGIYTDGAIESISKWSYALMTAKGVNDNLSETLLAQGITLGLSVERAQKFISVSADMAPVVGSIGAAFNMLVQASDGNERALKMLGRQFKIATTESTRFADVLEIIQKKTEGTAEAMAGTFAGELGGLGDQISTFLERAGTPLMISLTEIVKILNTGAKAVNAMGAEFEKIDGGKIKELSALAFLLMGQPNLAVLAMQGKSEKGVKTTVAQDVSGGSDPNGHGIFFEWSDPAEAIKRGTRTREDAKRKQERIARELFNERDEEQKRMNALALEEQYQVNSMPGLSEGGYWQYQEEIQAGLKIYTEGLRTAIDAQQELYDTFPGSQTVDQLDAMSAAVNKYEAETRALNMTQGERVANERLIAGLRRGINDRSNAMIGALSGGEQYGPTSRFEAPKDANVLGIQIKTAKEQQLRNELQQLIDDKARKEEIELKRKELAEFEMASFKERFEIGQQIGDAVGGMISGKGIGRGVSALGGMLENKKYGAAMQAGGTAITALEQGQIGSAIGTVLGAIIGAYYGGATGLGIGSGVGGAVGGLFDSSKAGNPWQAGENNLESWIKYGTQTYSESDRLWQGTDGGGKKYGQDSGIALLGAGLTGQDAGTAAIASLFRHGNRGDRYDTSKTWWSDEQKDISKAWSQLISPGSSGEKLQLWLDELGLSMGDAAIQVAKLVEEANGIDGDLALQQVALAGLVAGSGTLTAGYGGTADQLLDTYATGQAR